MPPEPAELVKDVSSPETSLVPTSSSSSCSEEPSACSSDSESLVKLDPTSPILYKKFRIPIEKTLKELLMHITGTNDLDTVTDVKLQVIARDMSLQHLKIHTPNLRELTLDGSVITSLRELGCGLKNLKVLQVNRCGLDSLDGICGLENIEEFHGRDNAITDASPFIGLEAIRVIDLKRNKLNCVQSLCFLTMCSKLEEMDLEGNDEITSLPTYRQIVKRLLPKLKTLDSLPLLARTAFDSDEEKEKPSENSLKNSKLADNDNSTPNTFSRDSRELISDIMEPEIEQIVDDEIKIQISFQEEEPKPKLRNVLLPPIKRSPRSQNRQIFAESYAVNFPPKVLPTTSLPTCAGDWAGNSKRFAAAQILPDIEDVRITSWDDDSDED